MKIDSFFRRIISQLLYIVILSSSVAQEDCKYSFSADFEISPIRTYNSSIAIIATEGSKHGTAYLIDGRGYFITAYHVIKDFQQGLKILGHIPQLSSFHDRLEFEVVEFLEDRFIDLALLKVIDNDWKKVSEYTTPLDPEFGEVNTDEWATCLGYPGSSTSSINKFDGTLVSERRFNTLQFQMSTYTGNSGGPLVNKKGRFLGTLVEYDSYNQNYGYFSLMENHKKLFDHIPINAKINDLEKQILRGNLAEKDLQVFLREGINAYSLSNLEMYLWGRKIAQKPYIKLPEIWNCVMQAFSIRIPNANFLKELYHISTIDDVARDLINTSWTAKLAGEEQRTIDDFLKMALEEKIAWYFKDRNLKFDSVLTPKYFLNNKVDDLFDSVRIKSVEKGYGKRYVSNLMKDYALNLLNTAKKSQDFNAATTRTQFIKAAIAFNWAAKIYEPFRARIYGNYIGECLFKLGEFSIAAEVYASAWNSGFNPSFVLSSYKFMSNLSNSSTTIEQAPKINGSKLDEQLSTLDVVMN